MSNLEKIQTRPIGNNKKSAVLTIIGVVIVILIGQIIIATFGEEIAYQGFFLGKGVKIFLFWLCTVVSSAVFAAGHIAPGNIGVVIYDITCVFIDSLVFSIIYRKSGNCVISTFSHILGNAISLIAVFLFF